MKDRFIITIDGYSSCGKSSLAKDLSHKTGFRYLDSGAMYRAVSLYCLQNGIKIEHINRIEAALPNINITFKNVKDENHCFLNGVDVENEIRSIEVANIVSQIATISKVRKFLVAQQREMGHNNNVIMDGRDIGTVVFPNAQLKIFLIAEPKIRALRRYEEMINKNMDTTLEVVTKNLKHRDCIDSTRDDSPLKKADDAIIIDNSFLDRQAQLDKAYNLFKEVIQL